MNKIYEIAKEFYGQYGLAMHTSQMLERGLLELYALQKYINDGLTENDYFLILSNPNKWTLGTVIKKVNTLNLFSNSEIELLETANGNRIFLAHMFWWERDIEFENNEELVKLHKEIFSFIDLFKHFTPMIDKMIKKIREDNNLSIEKKMGLADFKKREAYIKSFKKKK
jgi:hypothetical protein